MYLYTAKVFAGKTNIIIQRETHARLSASKRSSINVQQGIHCLPEYAGSMDCTRWDRIHRYLSSNPSTQSGLPDLRCLVRFGRRSSKNNSRYISGLVTRLHIVIVLMHCLPQRFLVFRIKKTLISIQVYTHTL